MWRIGTFLAFGLALAGCTPPPEPDLTREFVEGTPTDRIVVRSLQITMAEELAAGCPEVNLSSAQLVYWQDAVLEAYAAELELNPDQVPERFSVAFERLANEGESLREAYRAERGLGAPPHNAEEACRVVALERRAGGLIGRILQ